MIREFQKEYRWLSNFAPVDIEYYGIPFPSTENAYQAAKGTTESHIKKCSICAPGVAKRLGRDCVMRPDWLDIRLKVMMDVNTLKYKTEQYATLLDETGDSHIIEGNYWHDNFWGKCLCRRCSGGQNHLGIIIMEIRTKLREGTL